MRKVMGSYDFVAYRLTGSMALEINWAVESGAFDIRKRCWLHDQLRAYGIPEELFPEVRHAE